MQYFKQDEKNEEKLVCLLCSHYCRLKAGQNGLCGVNQNTGEQIDNLVYGYPVSLNMDPIEKKPLYHFLPSSQSLSLGTVGCNFKCPFCQNHSISQTHQINKKQYFSPKDIVKIALYHGAQSISFTYNEPTIFYPYAKDIALKAKEAGLKNVFVSNGFESKEVIADMKGLIDAANIDLKSFDAHYYKKELGGNLEIILENLKRFKEAGIWIEITTLIVPSKNDSVEELSQIAGFIAEELAQETVWHISAFHPDYKELNLPRTSYEILKRAYDIGKSKGLKYVYMGNIGIENPTLCTCGELLIKRQGFNVIENHLMHGKCPKCSKTLEGVF
jgi:pyruvate formate lyase activating enzyme